MSGTMPRHKAIDPLSERFCEVWLDEDEHLVAVDELSRVLALLRVWQR